MIRIDELLNKYVKTFGENFPIFCFAGAGDAEINKMVQKCLDDGEPFEFEPDRNIKY